MLSLSQIMTVNGVDPSPIANVMEDHGIALQPWYPQTYQHIEDVTAADLPYTPVSQRAFERFTRRAPMGYRWVFAGVLESTPEELAAVMRAEFLRNPSIAFSLQSGRYEGMVKLDVWRLASVSAMAQRAEVA